MLTQEILKSQIHYNPDTGVFTRIGFIDRWGNYNHKNFTLDKTSKEGYIIIRIFNKAYKAHRLAYLYVYGVELEDDIEVDHIDGNRSNNRFDNLRFVTRSVNMKNKSLYSNSSTGVIGVCKFGHRYRARINIDGKRISLGLYDTIEEAAHVRAQFEKDLNYHSNHGRTNES
jgi:hypothetical protein